MKFTKSLLALAVATSAFGAQAAPAPNLIQNGSFESTVVTSPYETLLKGSTALTGWTISNGSVDLVGSYWTASQGNQSLDLSGNFNGSIKQSFATVVGQQYHVSFDMAGNPDDSEKIKTLFAGLSSEGDYSFDATGKTSTNMGWTTKGFDFVGTQTQTTLFFSSTQDSAWGAAIDNVSVTAVPEPESYAMLLAGLGLMGAIARRRKQNQA